MCVLSATYHRKIYESKIEKLEINLVREKNLVLEATDRSEKFLAYLADCRRRAQLFEASYGALLTRTLNSEGYHEINGINSINGDPAKGEQNNKFYSSEESYIDDYRSMIQSLADLQKLLFSLNGVDPSKHLKADVTNLFDSILSQEKGGMSTGLFGRVLGFKKIENMFRYDTRTAKSMFSLILGAKICFDTILGP